MAKRLVSVDASVGAARDRQWIVNLPPAIVVCREFRVNQVIDKATEEKKRFDTTDTEDAKGKTSRSPDQPNRPVLKRRS